MTPNEKAPDKQMELITFLVGDQDFCMDIMLVREIRGWTDVTRLPHAPNDVMGVMNLRGTVVPIIDLSLRLGLGASEPKARSVVIITMIGDQVIGFIVDEVSDIIASSPGDIQPMPKVGGLEANDFVKGLIPTGDRTLRMLDFETLSADLTISAA